ncbi:MAG: M24 family metallopeptidase [Acidimicrobiia bacterium]
MINLEESASRRDALTVARLDRLIPSLMDDAGIDCWILISREYAEDPVVETMLPAKWMSSRRRTILLFLRDRDGYAREAVTRYEVDGLFPTTWDPGVEPDQWAVLARRISEARPESIAVNTSTDFAHADGLTATEQGRLLDALGPEFAGRIVSGEALAVRWLQTRLPEERRVLEEACAVAHGILQRALSPEAIDLGSTTTGDLEWWLRAEVQKLGTRVWFHPSVSVQRNGRDMRGSFASATRPTVIEPGDLVHIDFGLVGDHLCTDQQQHGYVLERPGARVPEGLREAMYKANQVQDILLERFVDGASGNEILARTLAETRAAGLDAMIYSHPIGYHGHGAGATIGLWDQQDGVPGSGDVDVFGPSAWSIELMNRAHVPEWDGTVAIMLEEEAWFEDGAAAWVDGRQTEIWAI